MAVSQKIKSGDDQPNGGEGIVSIGGARGLTAADKISSNHQVSPFPPLLPSQLDWTIAALMRDSILDSMILITIMVVVLMGVRRNL